MARPVVLVAAAFDPSGASGLPADLAILEALGIRAAGVVTAVLAGIGVRPGEAEAHAMLPALVRAQIRTALASGAPVAVKLGLLPAVPLVRAIALELEGLGVPVVLEPSLATDAGVRLLRPAAVEALARHVLPHVDVVVLDVAEVSALARLPVRSEADAKTAARRLQDLGARAVLLTGRSLDGDSLEAVLLDGRTWLRYRARVPGSTGRVRLGTAVAGWLARGEALPDAVERAVRALETEG